MSEHFSIVDAYKAQEKYCQEHDVPMFIGEMGICPSCGKSVFNKADGVGTWSVERAGKSLITGCPFCYATFVD